MPRRTLVARARADAALQASMRPRHDAAENRTPGKLLILNSQTGLLRALAACRADRQPRVEVWRKNTQVNLRFQRARLLRALTGL